MRNLIFIGAVALVASGCNTVGMVLTPKVDPSGSLGEKTIAAPIDNKSVEQIFGGGDLYDQGMCGKLNQSDMRVQMAGLTAQVLGAVGGIVIDYTVKAAESKVKEIRERSSKVWGGDWNTDVDLMKAADCIALIRYIPSGEEIKPDDIQMGILLRVIPFDTDSFQLSPILAVSRRSIALTKCESKCLGESNGHVSLSIAITQTYQKSTPEIAEGASETFTVGPVAVSEDGTKLNVTPVNNRMTDKNKIPISIGATKPILYVPGKGTKVFVKFAVTENGTLSGQENAEAEIKALGEALGPIAKAALKAKLDKLSASEGDSN